MGIIKSVEKKAKTLPKRSYSAKTFATVMKVKKLYHFFVDNFFM
jgi:hypothetical protein